MTSPNNCSMRHRERPKLPSGPRKAPGVPLNWSAELAAFLDPAFLALISAECIVSDPSPEPHELVASPDSVSSPLPPSGHVPDLERVAEVHATSPEPTPTLVVNSTNFCGSDPIPVSESPDHHEPPSSEPAPLPPSSPDPVVVRPQLKSAPPPPRLRTQSLEPDKQRPQVLLPPPKPPGRPFYRQHSRSSSVPNVASSANQLNVKPFSPHCPRRPSPLTAPPLSSRSTSGSVESASQSHGASSSSTLPTSSSTAPKNVVMEQSAVTVSQWVSEYKAEEKKKVAKRRPVEVAIVDVPSHKFLGIPGLGSLFSSPKITATPNTLLLQHQFTGQYIPPPIGVPAVRKGRQRTT